jgi:hypothetical protein
MYMMSLTMSIAGSPSDSKTLVPSINSEFLQFSGEIERMGEESIANLRTALLVPSVKFTGLIYS